MHPSFSPSNLQSLRLSILMINQNIKIGADSVVFTYRDGQLMLLLVKRKNEPYQGCWCLPGGFVEDDETLSEAAHRELQEETSLKLPAGTLEQFHTFDAIDRDPRFRTLTAAHTALLEEGEYLVCGQDDAAEARWWFVDELPQLGFDHALIVASALEWLGQHKGLVLG